MPYLLLVTFQVVLHHVRLDTYYVFRSCDVVVELGLLERNLTRDLSRFLCEICRDSFVFLFVKIYSLGIEVTFWSFGNRIFALV